MPQIDHKIGHLEAEVKALSKALDSHTQEIKAELRRNNEESKEGRAKLYQAMDDARLEASHTKRTAEATAKELREWRGHVDTKLHQIEKWTERGIGAWMVIVAGSSVVVAALVYAWKGIISALTAILPS